MTIATYADIKQAIRLGYSNEFILYNKPIGVASHIVEDLIERAKQELYVESNILPSEAGKLLYDVNS